MSALILPSCACPSTTPSIPSFSIARQEPFLVNPYFYEYESAPGLCYRPPWQDSDNSDFMPIRSQAATDPLPTPRAKICRVQVRLFDRLSSTFYPRPSSRRSKGLRPTAIFSTRHIPEVVFAPN